MITTLINKASLIVLMLLTIGLLMPVSAQTSLERYIETGLKNNLVIQQKTIATDRAMYALKAANSMFLPSVSIKGDYQSGEGGRNISLPLGDIMNPVYSTLNELTASNNFPAIKNVETYFLPNDFYDIKVRTSMPIYNSDLYYNREIRSSQVSLQKFDLDIYTRELTRDIKVAYYNYLSAAKSIAIYESALDLARQGKRINESLVSNGKSVKAYVLRSESEIQSLEARKAEALEKEKNARMYFNFLLNQSADTPVDTASVSGVDESKIETYLLGDISTTNRIELKALEKSASVYETMFKMSRAYWTPRLSAFVDLGSQASQWKFNNHSQYYFFGVQLDIPLFASGQNVYKVQQARLDWDNRKLQNEYSLNQIQLAANMARNNLRTSFENYNAGRKQLEAATAYYNLIEKGYREGSNSFLESVDARNQLTSASLQMIISKYQLMGSMANYEREISQ